MTDAWFGSEMLRWCAFLSLLSLLAIPAEQGRYKTLFTTLWIAMIAFAGVSLAGAAAAVVLGQPPHVTRTLFVVGSALAVSFSITFPALRRSYRDAELRKMAAADI